MGLSLVVPPSGDVIPLSDMKRHLKVDLDFLEEDTYITALSSAAVMHVETVLRRKLLTQRWKLTLNRFIKCIELPFPPVQAVHSVRYYNEGGVLTTLPTSDYRVNLHDTPAHVLSAYDRSFPSVELGRLGSVEVEYSVGYGTPIDVPHPIKQAVRLLTAHWFANREGVEVGQGIVSLEAPMGINALLWPFRDYTFP